MMRLRYVSMLLLAMVASPVVACGSKDSTPAGLPPRNPVGHPRNAELPPDLICPGAAVCPPSDDGTLFAAVATQDVTAEITEKLIKSASGQPWLYRATGGDTFDDANGNGKFDGAWMAGFDNGRAANGVADPQWVRTVVLKQGNTSIAIVSVDCIGFFYDEVQRIRDALVAAKVPISYLLLTSTHVHEARDTMGIWGVDDATSGLDKAYNGRIRQAAVDTIKQAMGKLEKSKVTFSAIDVDGHLPGTDPLGNGAKAFNNDQRDPIVIDVKMNTMRLQRADGSTITTLINWGSHPEGAGSRNMLLHSDFADSLRKGVEQGVDLPPLKKKDGLGGVAVFVQGAVGGLIGPLHAIIADQNGKIAERETDAQPELGIDRARVHGSWLAYYALASLEAGAGAQTYDSVRLGVRARQVFGHVENREYHVAIVSKLFDRKGYHFDESIPISATNLPDVLTEVAVVDIGPASLISVPGELFPESAIGGYDGSHTPKGFTITQPDNPNPPKLDLAPKDGYLHTLVDKGAKYTWTVGLGLDEVGYLVPAYDYVLDPNDPYYKEAKGNHYEETNSLGPKVEEDILLPLRDLLKNTPVPIPRP